MFPNKRPALCVAIHDVAPATWTECLRLLDAVRAVADIPLSWLVVPEYHHGTLRSRACEATLERLLAQGHELVLHGYTHQDPAPMRGHGLARFLRSVYTQREGEFAAIDAGEARRRIELGLAWFAARGWPVSGFVAPAWLLGPGAWRVLPDYPFSYTTTYWRFYQLHPARAILAPALVYAARNRTGRTMSPHVAEFVAALSAKAQLARVALHPRDAHHPELMRHAQRLVAGLLASREAMTKAAFASRLTGSPTSTDPNSLRRASANAHTRGNSSDSRSSAAYRPSC